MWVKKKGLHVGLRMSEEPQQEGAGHSRSHLATAALQPQRLPPGWSSDSPAGLLPAPPGPLLPAGQVVCCTERHVAVHAPQSAARSPPLPRPGLRSPKGGKVFFYLKPLSTCQATSQRDCICPSGAPFSTSYKSSRDHVHPQETLFHELGILVLEISPS